MISPLSPARQKGRPPTADGIARLKILIAEIESGFTGIWQVTMKSALGAKLWAEYKAARLRQSGQPTKESHIDALAPYVAEIREADRRYGLERNKPAPMGIRLMKKGPRWVSWETAYERAYETLEQILFENPGFDCYFDRPIRFGQQDGNLDVGPHCAPRVIGTRSPHEQEDFAAARSLALTFLEHRRVLLEAREAARITRQQKAKRKSRTGTLLPGTGTRWWASDDQVLDEAGVTAKFLLKE